MKMKTTTLNKTIGMLLSTSLLFGLLFISACNNDDDNEPEEYELAGTYTFKKAELVDGKEEIADALGFPAALIPTDITAQMAGGLLAEAPCTNPNNGAVELKANLELFFTCIGESNEEKTGTWSVNSDRTELNLNLAVAAGNLQLKIDDLTINEATNVIGGTITNFPITKPLLAGFLSALPEENRNAILAGIEDDIVIPITVDIEFQKVVS